MGKVSEISPSAAVPAAARTSDGARAPISAPARAGSAARSPAPAPSPPVAAPPSVAEPLTAYAAAERRMAVPPVGERGRKNENPPELGFWELLREDFVTHESGLFEQGFWAVANNRFGNWRMDVKSPLLRAPCSVAYRALEKGIEIFGGITLPYTTKLGRRVRLWHHGGMIIGARAIG